MFRNYKILSQSIALITNNSSCPSLLLSHLLQFPEDCFSTEDLFSYREKKAWADHATLFLLWDELLQSSDFSPQPSQPLLQLRWPHHTQEGFMTLMEYWQQHLYPLWYFNLLLFWVHLSHSGLSSLNSGCKFQTAEISELVFAFMSVSFGLISTTELFLQSWSSPETHYTLTNFIKYKVNNKVNMREHWKYASNFTPINFFLQKKCQWPFLFLFHFYDISWTVTHTSWLEYLLYFLLPLPLTLAWLTLNKPVPKLDLIFSSPSKFS